MSSQRIKQLEMALRDAISTYKGSDKLVSAERIEAWEHALVDDKAIGNEYPDLELPSELERMREQLFRMRAQLFDVSDELSEAKKDKARLDWLADPKNTIGNVTLPRQHIMDHPDSMRAAIDAAMEGDK
jgi:hypothetical protein